MMMMILNTQSISDSLYTNYCHCLRLQLPTFNFNNIRKNPYTGVHPLDIETVKKKKKSLLHVTEEPVLKIKQSRITNAK